MVFSIEYCVLLSSAKVYFYLFNSGWLVNFITIVILAVLTFVPVKFVHPLRVTLWRNVTIPMTVLWAAMTLSLIISSRNPNYSDWVYKLELALFALSSLYFAWISLWRTFVLVDKGDDEGDGAAAA